MATHTLAAERRRQALALIEAGRELSVSALAAQFGVTTETARRDLKVLEREGLIRRVYGGGIPIGAESPTLSARVRDNGMGKAAIGRLVASLVRRDQFIYLAAGSTLLAIAQALAEGPPLKVMTHMPQIADVLGASGRHRIFLTGGEYEAQHGSLAGPDVPEAVKDRVFDIAILSVYAVDPDFGIVDDRDYLFHLKRRLSEQSRRCIWAADHTKFGRSGHFQTVPFEKIDVLATDRAPPQGYLRRLTAAGVELLLPDDPGPRSGREIPKTAETLP